MRPLSAIIPSLEDLELLERCLVSLTAEVERRAVGDELVVVDDTGQGCLASALASSFPEVRVVSNAENLGFGPALLAGVEAASCELALCLNPDIVVRAGALDPLVASLEDDSVAAAVPRLLLDGVEGAVESDTLFSEVDGLYSVAQPSLGEGSVVAGGAPLPVAFAVGGACLLRRDEFLARGGFDALFEPFYWEDVDLGLETWRAGRRVLLVPESTFEHHHRGTIGRVVPKKLVRAAQERNRLLCQWKHLGGEEEWREHIDALVRWCVDAWLNDDREELEWLVLALAKLDRAFASRASVGGSQAALGEAMARIISERSLHADRTPGPQGRDS